MFIVRPVWVNVVANPVYMTTLGIAIEVRALSVYRM